MSKEYEIGLNTLVGFSRMAGAAIMQHFDPMGVTDAEMKADETPVTRMDRAAYEVIHCEVRRQFPDPSKLALWSEEQTVADIERERHGEARLRLYVDEVDGTVAAENGVPVFTHMQALVRDGDVVCSQIYDPVLQISYSADAHPDTRGATMYEHAGRGERSLQVRPLKKLGGKVRVGVVTWPNCPFKMQAVYAELERRGCIAIDMCSIGYMHARVACGQYAGVIFPGSTTFHDHAPGDLLVRMAGGVFTDMYGDAIRYVGDFPQGHIAACSEEVHAELLEIVKLCNGW